MQELNNKLDFLVRKRISELLEKPYAGSKAFKFNDPGAEYYSNCHGTMAFVLGLQDPAIKEDTHPDFIALGQMENLIEKYFSPSGNLNIGDLIAFYQKFPGMEEVLVHSALLIGDNGEIFHQSGSGGVFRSSAIDDQLASFKVDKWDTYIRKFKKNKVISKVL